MHNSIATEDEDKLTTDANVVVGTSRNNMARLSGINHSSPLSGSDDDDDGS